jgi:hypothetical protein
MFDLFGNPVRERHGQRGRPAFQVTDRNRNKVKLLLALGWGNERVANAIECSPATLKRHFGAELKARDQMRDRLEAERLMLAAEAAAAGNIGAHRVLGNLIDRNDRMVAERALAQQSKTDRVGKKEERAVKGIDADRALESALMIEAGLGARH